MPGLKVTHVSKRGHMAYEVTEKAISQEITGMCYLHNGIIKSQSRTIYPEISLNMLNTVVLSDKMASRIFNNQSI